MTHGFSCKFVLLAGLALLALGAVSASTYAKPGQPGEVVVQSVRGNFNQVWEELVDTLNGRGLVVSSTSYIKRMLERTDEAFEDPKKLFVDARVLAFCSATLAREMFDLDRHNMVFCPFKIAVYVIPTEADRVFLSYRRLGDGRGTTARTVVLDRVDQLIEELISATIKTYELFH